MKFPKLVFCVTIVVYLVIAPAVFSQDLSTDTSSIETISTVPKLKSDLYPSGIGLGLRGLPDSDIVLYFAIQNWFQSFGLELSFWGIYNPDAWSFWGGYKILDYGVILNTQYRFLSADIARWFSLNLYGIIGLGHRGQIEDGLNSPLDGVYRANFLANIGFGIEPILWQHFSIPVEIMYTGVYPELSLVPTLAVQLRARF